MIYTVEQDAIPDFIREQQQTLTEKNSWYAPKTYKLCHVYAHHQPSLGCEPLDKPSTLSATQLGSRLALEKLAQPAQAELVIGAFSVFARKTPSTKGAIVKSEIKIKHDL